MLSKITPFNNVQDVYKMTSQPSRGAIFNVYLFILKNIIFKFIYVDLAWIWLEFDKIVIEGVDSNWVFIQCTGWQAWRKWILTPWWVWLTLEWFWNDYNLILLFDINCTSNRKQLIYSIEIWKGVLTWNLKLFINRCDVSTNS